MTHKDNDQDTFEKFYRAFKSEIGAADKSVCLSLMLGVAAELADPKMDTNNEVKEKAECLVALSKDMRQRNIQRRGFYGEGWLQTPKAFSSTALASSATTKLRRTGTQG